MHWQNRVMKCTDALELYTFMTKYVIRNCKLSDIINCFFEYCSTFVMQNVWHLKLQLFWHILLVFQFGVWTYIYLGMIELPFVTTFFVNVTDNKVYF